MSLLEDNWILDIFDCLWYSIESDNELMITGSSDGWRESKGGGWNCKMDDERYHLFSKGSLKVHQHPALILMPTTVHGNLGASRTADTVLEITARGQIKTRKQSVAIHFAYLLHNNFYGSGVKSMFQFLSASPPLTNRIHNFKLPTINFEDITAIAEDSDWTIWNVEVPLQVEVSLQH